MVRHFTETIDIIYSGHAISLDRGGMEVDIAQSDVF